MCDRFGHSKRKNIKIYKKPQSGPYIKSLQCTVIYAYYDETGKTNLVSHSRVLYLTYSDYVDRWEEIADIFSREAVLKGSFLFK